MSLLAKLIPQIKLRVLLPCIAWGAVCFGLLHGPHAVYAAVFGVPVIALAVGVMDGRKIR
jgi:hypothetical protein